MPLLTAAMIVRDEASRLPACLTSIVDVVDEIVIVDTGSTDATVSIARSFGARVHEHPWGSDFAQARNAGLELARGAWILYIDADERLRPISRELVASTLEQATENVALRLRLVPIANTTPYWEFRLWRSDSRIRFAGAMHEKVTPSILGVAGSDQLTIGESELCLDHVGYDGDQRHKHARNLPLLRAQLAVEPANSYNWAHLARVLEGLDRPAEAEAALRRALDTARASEASFGVLAFLELIRRRRNLGHDVTALLDESLGLYPENVGLAGHKAETEIEAGRYGEALRWLERFDADPDMPIEDTISYPVELFGAWAAEARGLCYFQLGCYAEAAAAYRQAEELDPEEQAHRVKRVMSDHRARRQGGGRAAAQSASAVRGLRWAARDLVSGVAIDLGGISVGVRATDSVRAAAMHSLLGRVAPSEEDPIVQLAFGGHQVPLPDRSPDEVHADLRLWYSNLGLSLASGTSVSARVASGRAELGGYDARLVTVFHHVAPFLLASLLAPHGRFLLHAGAIVRDGQAVLVLGGSGLGKSTLVLGALRAGWSVLSDDLSLVRAAPGGPVVSGVPKPLVVPRDVVSDQAVGPPPLSDTRGRAHLPFEAWDRGWHPIRAVVVVGHGTSEDAEIEPLDPPWLLGLLVHSMLCRPPDRVRDYGRLATALCALPARQLLHSRRPEDRAQRAVEVMVAELPLG